MQMNHSLTTQEPSRPATPHLFKFFSFQCYELSLYRKQKKPKLTFEGSKKKGGRCCLTEMVNSQFKKRLDAGRNHISIEFCQPGACLLHVIQLYRHVNDSVILKLSHFRANHRASLGFKNFPHYDCQAFT